MTMEEAAKTREIWIQTFKEMSQHMRPEQAKNVKVAFNAYGMERKNNDDEEDEDEDTGKRTYMAKLPCGQIRNRCSYNAA